MTVPCRDNSSYQDQNPYWYKFTCFSGGTLGFVITPLQLSDDYDWQLYDITGHSPQEAYTNASLFVACNWSGEPGKTGASPAGNSFIGCGGAGVNTFSKMPTLLIGHDYLLMVSHFTNTQSGYDLDFSGGTAVISDPTQPALVSAEASCDATQVTIKVNKKLKCSSLTSSGSEFTIAPGVTVVGAAGLNCAGGFDLDSIRLTFNAPLAPGNYTVTINPGMDGNTLLDACDRAIASGGNVSFSIPPRVAIPTGTTSGPSPCTPNTIVITFPNKVRCSSIAPNGSDFAISGPSSVTIASATATCDANGQTTAITIQTVAPVTVPGNYLLTTAVGSDGNVLYGTCNEVVAAGLSTPFTVAPQTPLAMGTANNSACAPTVLTLNFAEPILCNSIAPNGSDFAITGPSAVNIVSATAACNANGETTAIQLTLASAITVDGSYQITAQTGTDGNVLIGNCSRQLAVGSFSTFSVPVAPSAAISSIDPPGCSPTSLTVHFDQPVSCNSIAANGSDFTITGPDPVVVSGAAGSCSNGLTTTVQLQLAAPIVKGGVYQLHLQAGSDGNTLLSECLRPSAPATVNFSAADTVSARFTYTVQNTSCLVNHVEFANAGGNGISTWTWTINNAPAGSGQPTLAKDFPSTSQQTVSLTVSNGTCSDTRSENLVFDDRIIAKFSAENELCPEDSLKVNNLSTGPVGTWNWSFGDGQVSSSKDPAPIRYPVTLRESVYNITLTATGANGCSDTKVASVKVLATCLIAVPSAFSPNNDGLNDYFSPLNAFKAINLDFKVFNRWGQVVFETTDWRKKWDGKLKGVAQPSDIFVWILRYTDSRTGEAFSQKGTVMLIR